MQHKQCAYSVQFHFWIPCQFYNTCIVDNHIIVLTMVNNEENRAFGYFRPPNPHNIYSLVVSLPFFFFQSSSREGLEQKRSYNSCEFLCQFSIPYLTDECGVWGLYPLYFVQQIPIKHKGNREFIFVNSGSRVFSWEKLMKSNLVCVEACGSC